jgi:membrane protein DedA with SNARE-associated domain
LLDVLTAFGDLLYSPWLLPVLVVLIAIDGPVPVLPSETLLMSAAALAFAEHDAAAVLGLFAASVLGSVIGDLFVYGLGRSSHRVIGRAADSGDLAAWVRKHLLARPGMALVGARLLPGGRLVSTAAAGRFGLALYRFVPCSVASSSVWSIYMLLIGLALGPVTGGRPLLCLVAGVAMALLTGAAFAVGKRVRARRRRPAAMVTSDAP